jgi:hypothetical protein
VTDIQRVAVGLCLTVVAVVLIWVFWPDPKPDPVYLCDDYSPELIERCPCTEPRTHLQSVLQGTGLDSAARQVVDRCAEARLSTGLFPKEASGEADLDVNACIRSNTQFDPSTLAALTETYRAFSLNVTLAHAAFVQCISREPEEEHPFTRIVLNVGNIRERAIQFDVLATNWATIETDIRESEALMDRYRIAQGVGLPTQHDLLMRYYLAEFAFFRARAFVELAPTAPGTRLAVQTANDLWQHFRTDVLTHVANNPALAELSAYVRQQRLDQKSAVINALSAALMCHITRDASPNESIVELANLLAAIRPDMEREVDIRADRYVTACLALHNTTGGTDEADTFP